MNETDARAADRAFYDDTDYAETDLEPAEDVRVDRGPQPRSTFALRLHSSTIEELRDVAERRGARPTQLARQWIVERLDQERTKGGVRDRLEERVAELERRLDRITRGVPASPVADLEAQADVARQLADRLGNRGSIEIPAEPDADLVVRAGEHAWVIQFKSGSVDLAPSLDHLARLSDRLDARPVLVAPQLERHEAHALSESSGVLVAASDDLDGLLAEIAPPVERSAG